MSDKRGDNWETERVIGLKEAAKLLKNAPTRRTLRRWCHPNYGCTHPLDKSRKVVLEARFVGAREMVTTEEAIKRFVQKLNTLE